MAEIASIKSVEFNIQTKYNIEDGVITQIFLFLPMSKKYFRYAYDIRYPLMESIESFLSKNLLSEKHDNVFFIDRTDNEDSIVIKYSFTGEILWSEIKGVFATLHIYFAPNNGCEYCMKAVEKDGFIYCPEKNKTMVKAVKRCDIFRQKRDLIIT